MIVNKMSKSVLVVDDNKTICLMLKSWLQKRGFEAETAFDVENAKHLVKENFYDLILSDIKMPETDGMEFLSWVKKYDSDIMVIMMTGFADIESAVESMKTGAADYISKPIDPEILFEKIDEAFKAHENSKKTNHLYYKLIKPPGEAYDKLFNQLNQISENNNHILILGDRGTGKASAVLFIYEKGCHISKPLVKLDSNDILSNKQRNFNNGDGESMLMIKFKSAKGGLLYISEVDQLSYAEQDELLSIITKQKKDDDFTQVIMSSEKSIDELKELLFPKLFNILVKDYLTLPNLKGCENHINFLTSYFIQFANHIFNKKVEGVDESFQKFLIEYNWPGNIQELKNTIVKGVLLTEEKVITSSIITKLFDKKQTYKNELVTENSIKSLRKENYEREKICQALELSKGNKTLAASILNIDRKTLYNKIKLYNITFQN